MEDNDITLSVSDLDPMISMLDSWVTGFQRLYASQTWYTSNCEACNGHVTVKIKIFNGLDIELTPLTRV